MSDIGGNREAGPNLLQAGINVFGVFGTMDIMYVIKLTSPVAVISVSATFSFTVTLSW